MSATACLHAALEIPRREEGEQQLLIDSRRCEINQTNSSLTVAALGEERLAAALAGGVGRRRR
jgi:hypothetical protein